MRKTLSLIAFSAAFGALPLAAAAQSDHNAPWVGADAGYDYLSHDHYHYDGPPPQQPQAREQNGYRDGHIERAPLTPYWAGVRQVYPYYGYGRCGCSANWYGRSDYGRGRYHRRYYDDNNRYYGDDLDTQDYGRMSYSYSTRRYTDQHLGHWGW